MNENFHSYTSRPYSALSAEEYEAFCQRVIAHEKAAHNSTGIALRPSNSQCKAVEVMCSGVSVAILEALAGRRPVNHIAKWLSQDCYDKIEARAQLTKAALRRRYAGAPLNKSPFAKNIHMPKTRRARAQQIAPDIFEVTLILEDFSKVRAMALRVEKLFKAWKITAIEIA